MRAWITRDPIDPAKVLAEVGGPGDGATVLFLGHVRERNDDRDVSAVRYEAYVAMAEATLAEIAGEVAARAGSAHVALVHRTGELRVGEVSAAIAVSTPHRQEAFDACRYAIEEIKRRLPVWKEEVYTAGPTRWLQGIMAAGEGAGE